MSSRPARVCAQPVLVCSRPLRPSRRAPAPGPRSLTRRRTPGNPYVPRRARNVTASHPESTSLITASPEQGRAAAVLACSSSTDDARRTWPGRDVGGHSRDALLAAVRWSIDARTCRGVGGDAAVPGRGSPRSAGRPAGGVRPVPGPGPGARSGPGPGDRARRAPAAWGKPRPGRVLRVWGFVVWGAGRPGRGGRGPGPARSMRRGAVGEAPGTGGRLPVGGEHLGDDARSVDGRTTGTWLAPGPFRALGGDAARGGRVRRPRREPRVVGGSTRGGVRGPGGAARGGGVPYVRGEGGRTPGDGGRGYGRVRRPAPGTDFTSVRPGHGGAFVSLYGGGGGPVLGVGRGAAR